MMTLLAAAAAAIATAAAAAGQLSFLSELMHLFMLMLSDKKIRSCVI